MSWYNGLQPQLRPAAAWLFNYGQQLDRSLRVTSVLRSYSEQARLYRRYLAGQSLFPAAPPGTSDHEIGQAFDMVGSADPHSDPVLRELGRIWKSWGGRWGGDYRDPIHFSVG